MFLVNFCNNYHVRNLINKAIQFKLYKCFISHVVYQVSCIDCNGSCIGETKYTVLERIAHHKSWFKGKGFCDHAIKTGHKINWNDAKIITKDNFDFRLLYKET